LYFQTLDDKSECVGVYADGKLHFDKTPPDLTRTWKYTGSITEPHIEYAWLYTNGASLEEVCPPHLKKNLLKAQKRFLAHLKAFELGKINLREHCFYDLIPKTFLLEFCEIRNQITKHVFESFEKPQNYDLLADFQKLLHKIQYQNLNLNKDGCRHLYHNTASRRKVNGLLKGAHHVEYNLFGTVTGRLTTRPGSFPILTLKKELRQLIKPNNDWFVSLDYNGAEVRTFLQLAGFEQPVGDVHEWNIKNLFNHNLDRDTAKTLFFSWLYNPESNAIKTIHYDRKKVLDKWYDKGYIITPYKRKIKVDERRALSYLAQSTTSDRVLSKAVEIDKFLEGKKSTISHILHDEVVIDLCNTEKHELTRIKEIFETDGFEADLKVGKNYLDLEGLNL